MSKVHVNYDYVVNPCGATTNPCPFSEGRHFTDPTEAETKARKALELTYGKLGDEPLPETPETLDQLNRLIEIEKLFQEKQSSYYEDDNTLHPFLDELATSVGGKRQRTTVYYRPEGKAERAVQLSTDSVNFLCEGYWGLNFTRNVPWDGTAEHLKTIVEQADHESETIKWDEDKETVKACYSNNYYRAINNQLRRGDTTASVQVMDELIAEETLSEPTVVYRGIAVNSGENEQYPVDEATDHWASYTSWSTSPMIADMFAKKDRNAWHKNSVVLVTTLPAGTPVLRIDGYEQELVTPRGFKPDECREIVVASGNLR